MHVLLAYFRKLRCYTTHARFVGVLLFSSFKNELVFISIINEYFHLQSSNVGEKYNVFEITCNGCNNGFNFRIEYESIFFILFIKTGNSVIYKGISLLCAFHSNFLKKILIF